jgi:hypothetical protein
MTACVPGIPSKTVHWLTFPWDQYSLKVVAVTSYLLFHLSKMELPSILHGCFCLPVYLSIPLPPRLSLSFYFLSISLLRWGLVCWQHCSGTPRPKPTSCLSLLSRGTYRHTLPYLALMCLTGLCVLDFQKEWIKKRYDVTKKGQRKGIIR